jgi:3-hydroxymyristoyl/3-hydroxydecanoyl-(acyl carrier protein) dehydratase/1-acyl-sn-glycerol-3-phosphate acyltransferase
MPEPPLLLADRMVGIDAEPLSLQKGTIWTETDITADRWYLHDGYLPPGVMIECGQADLMLISYLGIDVRNNKGERKYRLLGCELTYHGTLPSPGETLRYDIHCDGHANQGPVRLFFFHYDCRVDGELRLTVRGGQAGFFSDQELVDSAGILWRPETQEIVPDPKLDPPPVPLEQRRFTPTEVASFAESRPWECFRHAAFDRTKTHNRTPHIQTGRMLFLGETELDPQGGPWKRGYLRSEVAIHSDDWFFAGHFKNDPCMPGTLMFDGCLQAMAFYLSALGVTVDRDGWRFQPVMGEPFDLKCRGQVTPTSKRLIYEIFVEEFSAGPIPTLYADLLCTVFDPEYGEGGLGAFHARRVGLQLVPDWPLTSRPQLLQGYVEPKAVASSTWSGDPEKRSFAFDYKSLLACAWGKPSDAFGEMYRIFDGTRRVARLPGPPYHFMSRLTKIDGEVGKCVPGAVIELEYDVPNGAWYFDENGNRTMPFAVLLEAALQPCGWLASFVGSALTVNEDLSFRNLDGTGTLTEELFSDSGTLRTRVKITNISKSAGMIIEAFTVECFLGDRKVYVMDTVFGFFPKVALENQVGLPTTDAQRALLTVPAERTVDLSPKRIAELPRLAQPMLFMLDRADLWPTGGAAGLGQLRGHKDVDPHEWFFKAHFFQDPVQPGSLGIEAMIQLLQVYMKETGMGEGIADPRFEPLALGRKLTWKYRGQVVPTNKLIQSTLEITERGTDADGHPYAVADASLWVDGKRIYEAKNVAMRIVSGKPPAKARIVLDPAQDPWIADHAPTWTVPALPMMSMVELLAQHAEGQVTALTDVKVKRWLTFAGPRRVWTQQDGEIVTLLAETTTGEETIASARLRIGDYEQPRASLPAIPGEPAPDPYESGQLFHGPAFQRLRSLVIGPNGSSAILDATPTAVPVGRLHPVLLDAATHGIPHDSLHRWEPKIAADKVAYPAFVPEIQVFGTPPTTGTVRAEVRYTGLFAPDMPSFEVQLVKSDGTLWARMKLVEACFPKGPIGLAAPHDRRGFLRDHAYVPGLRLSRLESGKTRLSRQEVDATDWLPGTVERIYGTREVAGIAVREHVAAEHGLHPGLVCDAVPLTRHHYRVTTAAPDVVVETIQPPTLDLAPVKRFWSDWFARGPWPVEDLYYGLIERFVRRVVLTDPAGFQRIEGRSALYLSNHQIGVESLVFSIVASALQRMPTVTLAKIEHKATWLGKLIAHSFAYPGVVDPAVIAFFDRDDKASLPSIIAEFATAMKGPGRSVMVHVEGTRSLTCRNPVEKMSGAFLDLAIAVGAPVIPVRFVGGLPAEPLDKRLEFPVGMGQQELWFGTPIEPAALQAMPLGERKKHVVGAINALGPAHADERPFPGDPAFAASVDRWRAERGVDAEHATLWRVLEGIVSPCPETQALLDAVRNRRAPKAADPAVGRWLAELARRLGGDPR